MHPSYALVVLGLGMLCWNVRINGVQLLFPHFVAYGLICIAAFQLRREHRLLGWASVPAGLLAVMAVPDCFVTAMRVYDPGALRSYYSWTFYPFGIAMAFLDAMLGLGIALRARRRGLNAVAAVGILAGTIAVAFDVGSYVLPPLPWSWLFMSAANYAFLLMFMGAFAYIARDVA